MYIDRLHFVLKGHAAGPAPMDIDGFENIQLNDTSQEMDYETSADQEPLSHSSQV